MADMFLNFKDFLHHVSDDHTTTLKHKHLGHKIVLAHKALSDKNKKALEEFRKSAKMADGGIAPIPDQGGQSAINDQKKTLHDVGTAASGGDNKPTLDPRSWWAEGGQVKPETLNYKDLMQRKKEMNNQEANKPIIPKRRMAEGGMADEDSEHDHINNVNLNASEPGYIKMAEGGLPCLNPHCSSHGKPHPNCRCYGPGGPQAEGFAEGGMAGIKYCAYGFPHHAGCEYAKGVSVQGQDVRNGDMAQAKDEAKGRAREERHVKPSIQGLAHGGEAKELEDAADAMDAGGDIGGAVGVDAPTAMAQQPMPQATAPAQPMAQQPAPQAPGQPVAPQYAAPIQASHTPMQTDTPDDATKSMAQHTLEEDQKYAGDLDSGAIHPKTYSDLFHYNKDGSERSTMGKVATIFGVLASGLGSGLTHQPNAALQMMDKVINNDIDAQKQSAQNKQSHWNMNYQHALESAQANGMDAAADHTKAQAALQADTWTKMQADRNALAGLSNYIKNMPEGPQKQKYSEAYSYLVKATDASHVNMANQADAQNQMVNGQHGMPSNSTIQQPAPQVIKPRTLQKSAGNASQNSVLTADSSGTQETKKGEKEKPPIYQVLNPDADRRYKNIQSGMDPIWSKNPELQQQYTQAKQAEKVLNGPKGDGTGGIHDIMNQMHEAQNNMGLYGHLHGAASEAAGQVPLIGAAANAAMNIMPNTHSEKRFNALKTNLESDIGTALQGIMTPTDIHNAVSKYAPAYQDTPEDVKWKENQLVQLVQKALKTSALTGAKLTKP